MLEIKISVSILREGKKYVAFTPALDLSTSGKSFRQVKKRFNEAVGLFFEELIEKNILEECLKDLGWRNVKKGGWSAPQIISQKLETFCVPA